jgi:hypothetical protein
MADGAIVIDRRYRGFEQVAQGGYTSGLLAGFLDSASSAAVTTRSVASPSGGEGRRLFADAALLAETGEPVAVSRQTAVITDAGVPLGLATISE